MLGEFQKFASNGVLFNEEFLIIPLITKRKAIQMSDNSDELIISGVHLELTEALKSAVTEKMDKLFRHEGHIIRIRVELEYNAHNSKQNEYIATRYHAGWRAGGNRRYNSRLLIASGLIPRSLLRF